MKSRWIVANLVIALLPGCRRSHVDSGRQASPDPIVGIYTQQRDRRNSLELRSDHSFVLSQGRAQVTGTYVIEGQTLQLRDSRGVLTQGRVDRGTLVDSEGHKWAR